MSGRSPGAGDKAAVLSISLALSDSGLRCVSLALDGQMMALRKKQQDLLEVVRGRGAALLLLLQALNILKEQ